MGVLFVVIPIALLLAGLAVAAFMWMARSGQLDDLESPARRMLFDDDDR
ncbi:MAG: cbb3-type cytochrome oxidase assembly protein CcoS [Planctomycetota bacterium]